MDPVQHEQERLQGCIDLLTADYKSHGEKISALTTAVEVLRKIVLGNGHPGVVGSLDRVSSLLDQVDTRLVRMEHQNSLTNMRRNDLFRSITLIVTVIGMFAGWLLTILQFGGS